MCDEDGLPKVMGVYERFEVIGVAYISFIKDLANLFFSSKTCRPSIVILAQSKGPFVPAKPSDI